jgi:hypothetical protein
MVMDCRSLLGAGLAGGDMVKSAIYTSSDSAGLQ